MSEIREELEHFAKLAEEQALAEEAANSDRAKEETSKSKEDADDEYSSAPKSYIGDIAAKFSELPEEWRRYLHAREAEIDKGFKELRNRREIDTLLDEVYAKRTGELQGYGIKSQNEWLKNLVDVDEMLSRRPEDAIKMLSEVYNLKKPQTTTPAFEQRTMRQVMQEHIIRKTLDDFVTAVNDNGEKKHPFYGQVIPEMCDLLSSGLAKTIDEAYEKAVWFNQSTRDKLLAERTQNSLELKSKDAKKAKDVSFAPKGKTVIDTNNLTLREELEMRFAALMGNED